MNLIREYFPAIPVGLDGLPVERTPMECPYSYDEFVLYKSPQYRPGQSVAWSDRMMDQNRTRFEKAVAKTWPRTPRIQLFTGKSNKSLKAFLQNYMNKPVQVTAILQGCNRSNGYPYWVFVYTDPDQTQDDK